MNAVFTVKCAFTILLGKKKMHIKARRGTLRSAVDAVGDVDTGDGDDNDGDAAVDFLYTVASSSL